MAAHQRAKQAHYRARQNSHRAVLRVDVDLDLLASVLVMLGVLPATAADNRQQIEAAFSSQVRGWLAGWG